MNSYYADCWHESVELKCERRIFCHLFTSPTNSALKYSKRYVDILLSEQNNECIFFGCK